MYDVAVLAEQPLSALDAAQVTGLHDGLDEPVRYHLVLSGTAEQATASAELIGAQARKRGNPGAEAVSAASGVNDPIDALVEVAERTGVAEVIVLTVSHPVRETLHRDWSSQVRRRLGLPTLHLLEHESFDEQAAGQGEGNTVL